MLARGFPRQVATVVSETEARKPLQKALAPELNEKSRLDCGSSPEFCAVNVGEKSGVTVLSSRDEVLSYGVDH